MPRPLPPLLAVLALCLAGCPEKIAPAPAPDAGAAPRDGGAPADAGLDEDGPVSDADRNFAHALTGHRSARYPGRLAEVKKRGVLRVLTRNNSTSYFLHRGQEKGFHFELAKLFADELGVRLEMVVPPTSRDLVPWLLEGRGDIVIAALDSGGPRVARVKLTRPYLKSSLVVVTRTGRTPRIDSVEALSQATLLVPPSSSGVKRMRALSNETGKRFHVRAARQTLEQEELLDMVAAGKADAALVDKRIADVELTWRDDIEIAMELPGAGLEAAFAVQPKATALHAAADDFLRRHYRGTLFNIFYKRYHQNARRAEQVRNEELRADKSGQLTPWDPIFQEAARKASLDWRLLAAQAYQESRFDPNARSSFGALGLMQMLPGTAREVGVADPFDPVQSIHGGARYMRKLVARYDDDAIALKDRVRFALAAYNVGFGHLADARRLATAEGRDKNRWFGHVAEAMKLLSKPRYYRKARYGYCRGSEPVGYVSQIQSRYDAYVALTDKQPPPP